jgi:hypothetical protein
MATFLGKRIVLKGISQKGKNRIKQHGDQWTVLAETDRVLFSSAIGSWIFIAPLGCGQNDKASRWVKAVDDIDFVVSVL